MKLKLDENIGERGRQLLTAAGHDVATVLDQGLQSAADPDVIAACGAEGCCLVTLDLDFSNPFAFPPERYAGIAVLRLPRRPTGADLLAAARQLADALAKRPVAGRLWIVERARLREYTPPSADDADEAPSGR
jgi:hypothetical protein